MESYQDRVHAWMMRCFGPKISFDKEIRSHRFLEEALELVQAAGCTVSEAHDIVDYVFGRPTGEIGQEVGGVAVTFNALCTAHRIDIKTMAEKELDRVWEKIEMIRVKNAAKPRFG